MDSEGVVVRTVCGAVVQDEGGHVLMLRRSNEGSWGLPGGCVEPGETWERATLRECREETGWHVALHGLLGLYSDPLMQVHRYPSGNTVHFFGAVFLASPLQRDGEPNCEASEVGWFSLDALPQPLFAPDLPVLEDAAREAGRPFIR